MTTCCSGGSACCQVPAIAADAGRPVRPRAGRRVPGHQRAPGLDPAAAEAGRARRDGGRRRRAGDLRLPRRHGAQHPGLPGPVRAAGRDRQAGAQLPLGAADPGRGQRRHGPRASGYAKELGSTRSSRQKPVLAVVRDDLAQVDHVVGRVLENREAGVPLREQAVLFRTAHHSAALELELARRNIPFVKYGGLRFLEAAHVKDVLAILRWAENPRDRVAAFRVLQLLPGIGPGIARKVLAALEAGRLPARRPRALRPPPAAAERWPGLIAAPRTAWRRHPGRCSSGLVRRFYDPLLEELYDFPAGRRADLDQLERLAAASPSPRALPHRADPRPARGRRPRGRAAGQGRGLPDPLDHPLRQGPGVAGGLRPQLRRRLHPLRHGDRHGRGDRGGAAAALRRHDPRPRRAASGPAASASTPAARRGTGDRYVRVPRSRFITESMLRLFEVTTGRAARAASFDATSMPAVDIGAGLRGMWE